MLSSWNKGYSFAANINANESTSEDIIAHLNFQLQILGDLRLETAANENNVFVCISQIAKECFLVQINSPFLLNSQ